jgi:hypothetical protein
MHAMAVPRHFIPMSIINISLSFNLQHPSYSGTANGYPNDIAVLGFSSISTNSNVGFIALATSSDGNYAGSSCVISGWGLTASGTLIV